MKELDHDPKQKLEEAKRFLEHIKKTMGLTDDQVDTIYFTVSQIHFWGKLADKQDQEGER